MKMTAYIHKLDERAEDRRAGLHLTHEYLYRCVTDYRELLYLMMMMIYSLQVVEPCRECLDYLAEYWSVTVARHDL